MKIHTFIGFTLQAAIFWSLSSCEPRFGHMRIIAGRTNSLHSLRNHHKSNLAPKNVFTAANPLRNANAIHLEQTRVVQGFQTRKPDDSRIPNRTNSPIFYVKLPPTTTNYIRKASPPTLRTRPVHVPLKFRSNGKPSNIYVANNYEITTWPPVATTKPKQSKIFRVKGPFRFNGKPASNVALYNSSSFKTLQQLYPKLKNAHL